MRRWIPVLLLLILTTCAQPLCAEVLYKRYYVHSVNGQDLLSEPYTVQPKEYVIKILKARGEISNENFPLFLNIFKLINNHIPNINKIHPGQRIFIPLKWLEPDALPGQRKGIVDLPFISAAPVKELLAENSSTRTVKSGDSISRIVSSSFGPMGSKTYQDGMKLFRLVNPQIKDINRIYVGQKLNVPSAEVLKQEWAESVLQDGGEVILTKEKREPAPPTEKNASVVYKEPKAQGVKDPFQALPKLIGGVLLNRGRYYFPTPDGKDFAVNLPETPILQLPEGRRLLFTRPGGPLTPAKQRIMGRHFKNLSFSEISEKPSLSLLLNSVALTFPEIVLPMPLSYSQEGLTLKVNAKWGFRHSKPKDTRPTSAIIVSEVSSPSKRFPVALAAWMRGRGMVIREALGEEAMAPLFFSTMTPPKITRITPKSRPLYVEQLAKALGLIYDPNVSISFAYAGMQIEATTNMLRTFEGNETLVDFGSIYGDAVFAIEQSGLQVVTVGKEDYLHNVTLNILSKLGIPFEENPVFVFGEPNADLTGSVKVDGILIYPTPNVKKLVVSTTLPDEITAYLHTAGVGIIAIK